MKMSPRIRTILGGGLSVLLGAGLIAVLAQGPPADDVQVRAERDARPERRRASSSERPRLGDRPQGLRPDRVAPGNFAATDPDCNNTSAGLTPLTELRAREYEGAEGGLYEGGTNARPAAHDAAGVAQAKRIGPLDANGAPDPNGRYVMLGIGISNTVTEFAEFERTAASDPTVNDQLVIVNGAQGGVAADQWADPQDPAWDVVDERLASFGVTGDQVAVAWVKVANRVSPVRSPGPFPAYAEDLQSDMESIARILKDRYPNLRIAYYSSRTYGGYADERPGNPEPFAYESGFSVKWLIEDQIEGTPELNFDPKKGPVEAPWLAWGPYLWADGLEARNDGLEWECADFQADGTHPNHSGAAKVTRLLLEFVHNDPTAVQWYSGQ